jgi:uncharacterized protein
VPAGPGPFPVVVAVEGSGPATRRSWGRWPEWLAGAGVASLAWDKPGCGDSEGDWREQSLDDRATEVLAAAAAVRRHPAVGDRPVAALGGSQGGWVAPLAASRSDQLAAVVSVSGPGVTVAAQERYRVAMEVSAAGFPVGEVAAAVAAFDARVAAIERGDPPEAVHAAEAAAREAPWFDHLGDATVEELAFLAGILAYDPVPVLERVTCPLLAVWGGRDTAVPVVESVAAFDAAMRAARNRHATLVVLPGADHGLRLTPGEPWGSAGRDLIVRWLAETLGT